MVSKRFSRL